MLRSHVKRSGMPLDIYGTWWSPLQHRYLVPSVGNPSVGECFFISFILYLLAHLNDLFDSSL